MYIYAFVSVLIECVTLPTTDTIQWQHTFANE